MDESLDSTYHSYIPYTENILQRMLVEIYAIHTEEPMIYFQAVVEINGGLHLHSQLFTDPRECEETILKNTAYKLMKIIEVEI